MRLSKRPNPATAANPVMAQRPSGSTTPSPCSTSSPSARSLKLEVYLGLEFDDYALSRSTLNRHLQAHPAWRGIERLRCGEKTPHRNRYEAHYPREGWQLDAKGPFAVRFQTLGRQPVHAFTILDDHTRFALAGHLAHAPTIEAAITVLESAGAKWGLADRFQLDKGSAFASPAFLQGLA